MVRHEAAEALGGIATPEVLPYLKEWMVRPDAPTVVRESCQVAIDMWEVRRFLASWLCVETLMCTFVSTKTQISFNTQMA